MTALMDVLQGAIDIDTNIFLFINGMHNTFFDYFMSAYSGNMGHRTKRISLDSSYLG